MTTIQQYRHDVKWDTHERNMANEPGSRTGVYVGKEARFKGRTALLRMLTPGVLQAQFDKGAGWETHSWLTFGAEDWMIESCLAEPTWAQFGDVK